MTAGLIKRRVVCAALRGMDGGLLLGIRHYDMGMWTQIHARKDFLQFLHRPDADQGFVDQWGVFMDREEAYKVAKEAGQIIRPEGNSEGRLYTESIY